MARSKFFFIVSFVLLNVACWIPFNTGSVEGVKKAKPEKPSKSTTEHPSIEIEKKEASNHSVSVYPLKNYNPLKSKHNHYRVLDLARVHALIAPNRLKNPHTSTTQPYQRAVICGCAKCGSSSYFKFLYRLIFDKPFTSPEKGVWVQKTHSKAWKGAFQRRQLSLSKTKEVLSNPKTFSFALIREPISRLISAWKSKLACDGKRWNTDTSERWRFTEEILHLSEMPIPKQLQGLNPKNHKSQAPDPPHPLADNEEEADDEEEDSDDDDDEDMEDNPPTRPSTRSGRGRF